MPDYYTILGVASSASSEEIQRAYRRLARRYHPDRNGGDQVYVERMKAINAARDLLSDPAQRAVYDAQYFRATYSKPASQGRPVYGRGSSGQKFYADSHTNAGFTRRVFRPASRQSNGTEAAWLNSGWLKWFAIIVWVWIICFYIMTGIRSLQRQTQDAKPSPTINQVSTSGWSGK